MFAMLLCAGCGGSTGDGGGTTTAPEQPASIHAHEEGAHGGEVVVLGNGEVHVEFAHDDSKGRIDLYLMGADCEVPLEVTDAPAINLKTAEGPKQLATRPAEGAGPASHFEVTDPSLADHHLDGQLVVRALGKQYFAPFPSHEHESGPAHVHAENTISLTSWTESCEWFVELEIPEAGKPAAFAAHVTTLDSFQPVTAGAFRVEASSGGQTASTHADAPARPGIFTPSITLPAAGEWALRLTFEGQGLSDAVEWTVTVFEAGQAPAPGEDPTGFISFLKEQQWKIPFATAEVRERNLYPPGEVLAVEAGSIVDDGGARVVFVQRDGESFERRVVEVGVAAGPLVEIRSGLAAGERVVTIGGAAVREAAAGR